MSHYTCKTHVFRDDTDHRTVVVTEQVSDCGFSAFILEGRPTEIDDDVDLTGFGRTRMEAIANLQKAIDEAAQ
jgi:hypothetical protein